MDAKKEALTSVLNKKSQDLDDAIRLVSGLIQNVKDDVVKVKDDIHTAFNAQMNLLHHREELLFRQIDVLSSSEINFFHTRNAELHHVLGNLESYLRSREESIDYNLLDDINRKIEHVNHFKKKNNLHLQFFTESADLQRAIQNFGQVGMSGALVRSHFEGSLILPSKIEYEDEDHQYFYKTLNEINAEKNFVNDKVKFPNLQLEQNEWLASPQKNSLSAPTPVIIADTLLKIGDGNNMSSVQNWLREMTSTDECELGCRSAMNSHRCSWNENSSQSSVDDSVVLLSMPRSNSLYECVDVPLDTLTNPAKCEWLSNYSRENEKNFCGSSCSQNSCCLWTKSTSPKNYVDKNIWLRKTDASEEKHFSLPDIKETCRANETCKNYFQCINDENCVLASIRNQNLENSSPGLPSDERKALRPIQPLFNIMFNKGNWHISDVRRNDDNELEMKSDGIKKSFEFPKLHSNSDLKNWLHPDHQSITSEEKEMKSTDNLMLINRTKWLADTTAYKKVNSIRKNIAAMFHSYFDPTDLEMWLTKSNNKQL